MSFPARIQIHRAPPARLQEGVRDGRPGHITPREYAATIFRSRHLDGARKPLRGPQTGFLARVKHRFPQWYCFILMGFVLGQRPSTLRPLRRKGPNADIDLVAKKLYIRRSNSLGQEIMDTTKTGNELELHLPDELIAVIDEHMTMLDMRPVTRESEFLFPSPFSGKMISKAALNRPFREIAKEMGLTKKLSPRAMRRTYQDLADEARLRAVTAMAVSGHRTLRMKHLYSTAHDDEVREGISKVIGLATAKSGSSNEADHEKAS